MNNVSKSTKNIAKLGILAAISVVLVAFIHIPFVAPVSFLEYDPADVPILLGTFAMGPAAGFLLTVLTSVIQGVTVSSASSWYGIVMHILATGANVLVAGNIYSHKKTKKRAIIALICGCIAHTLSMIPANLLITPAFMGVTRSVVVPLLGWIVLFNLMKTGINAVLTFLIYKKISPILHK